MSLPKKNFTNILKYQPPASGRWWIRAFIITICLFALTSSKLSAQAILAQEGIPSASLESNGPIYLPMVQTRTYSFSGSDWTMAAANPQRTSWVSEEVSGNLRIEWYRPIEAYIPQNSQIIASGGLLFISTARGLYALDAADGNEVWRFDTELPLGNSPTVSDGVIYVAGYDRKLHALNAVNGLPLWSFDGAKAGYNTNPLVVDGKVFLGNRDGHMYAVGAHGSSRQGQLLWSYKTGGPINLSAAYRDGIVYFAANDNHAYALRGENGALLWKSDKLPGIAYHSYWPVIYQDKVIFSVDGGYRIGLDPGTRSVLDSDGVGYSTYTYMELGDLFAGEEFGAILGLEVSPQSWSNGYPVIDASRVTEYLENKPWRRTYVVLNTADGGEFTFDSDGDGRAEYMPVPYWGTKSGNRYPPIVGSDGMIYQNTPYIYTGDSQGIVTGWNLGTKYLSVIGGQAAIVEPQAISGGGNLIYRNLCCDRFGDYFDTRRGGIRSQILWTYNLEDLAPGYDDMWAVNDHLPRLQGWYQGNSESINGIYHNHGDQNPIIPHNGKLYVHRSNAIIAFGPGSSRGKLPLVEINSVNDSVKSISPGELIQNLELEISKIIEAGHLRPGYYNAGQFTNYSELADYFDNPGDTIYTLAQAYPYLSPQLQGQTRVYLQNEFQNYFDPELYASVGWADGATREAMQLPPEVEAALSKFPKRIAARGFSWQYPPHNIYAMWKYAEIFRSDAGRVYDIAKGVIQVPVPDMATSEYFKQRPFELNAYIAGYIGFLELQDLAGRAGADAQLRASVVAERDRLLNLRVNDFSKDTYWVTERYHLRSLNVARNFMMLVPELGDYLHTHALEKVREAVGEYDYIAPYWFVSRYESMMNEGVMSPLYNYPAMFQAKAFILKESQPEITKYLDVPAFERGDLFYIQNLVAAIQASSASSASLTGSRELCDNKNQ
jgi:outer membrane protein assembly factor BamB